MFPISDWKNTFLRRTALIVLMPIAVVWCIVVGAALGILTLLEEIPSTWKGAWKGRR